MKKEYYIIVDGKKVFVSEEVYKMYWKDTNHANYLERVDRKHGLLYFSEMDKDGHLVDNIPDKNVDVEKLVEMKALIDRLNIAMNSLTKDEREIVERLFFEDESLSSVAKRKKVSYQAIQSKKNTILAKLKKFFEEK
ncbi:RNA polymerase sigma factor [Streptococcus anginosus]|jgi:sigma-70, region 4 subfamily|uniref:RNA polymerase sigma factor n=1 Tax=Streptococcus anginosus TaxID=1328 RepID=UPI001CB48E47|nr:sigma factor-like helix-turn-helix DNA-binding protein [Streptococcus anginosus]MBF1103631.1 sigma-70 family RNA polymerase sigma factor [Solobacterium sp.]